MTKLFDHMRGPWVVTYEIESPKGLLIAEFYRGDRATCERIEAHSSVGEDDQRPNSSAVDGEDRTRCVLGGVHRRCARRW